MAPQPAPAATSSNTALAHYPPRAYAQPRADALRGARGESWSVVAYAGRKVLVDVDGVDARGLQRVALQVGAVRL